MNWTSICSILFVVAIWAILSPLADMNARFLPEFTGVASQGWQEVTSGRLIDNLSRTLWRVLTALAVSLAVGAPLGLLSGLVRSFGSVVSPWIEFFRGIPTSMLFPLFIVSLGIGELAKVGIVAFVAIPILYISIVASLHEKSMEEFRCYYSVHRARKPSKSFFCVSLLWFSLPALISGSKICIAVGLILVIVTEMFFVASSGVGWAANRAYQALDIDLFYVYVLTTGLIGLSFNVLFDRLLTRVKHATGR